MIFVNNSNAISLPAPPPELPETLTDFRTKEQVEEEANCSEICAKLRLIGDDKHALLLIDQEMATRTFVAPVIG